MLNLLRRYDLGFIKLKFIIIYFLNASDIIFTLILLKSGAFIEGNLFMKKAVQNTSTSMILKLGLPMLLLFILYKRIKQANSKQLLIGNILINCCMIFYVLINVSHLIWIILYNIYLI